MKTKKFHIGDVLTITTGKLLSKDYIDGVYKILDWMSDQDCFTHELPEMSRKYRPLLLEMYPELSNIDVSNISRDNWDGYNGHIEWLEVMAKKYGEWFDIPKVGEGRTENPISSFERMLNK
jgi:hypothetical protein